MVFQVNNVRLPDDGSRSRGFGYAEFEDRQGLIDALGMNDEVQCSWKSLTF